MLSFNRLMVFVRTDILWVAAGQLIALIMGLVSLKIFTNLFSAEQYAFIALMMSLSAWIWTGVYQPLNQTIFRFYSLATEQNWQSQYFSSIKQYEINLAQLIFALMLMVLFYCLFSGQPKSILLLVVLSTLLGISYGIIHGIVSFFMAQRKRKPVTVIQSGDGSLRLVGGLIAYYVFSQTVYATATGLVIAGMLFLLLILIAFRHQLSVVWRTTKVTENTQQKQEFSRYFKKMYVITLLNASVIHLDKWLLLILLGTDGLGKYAVLYMLAMTMTTVIYVFFEMLGFPLIINQKSTIRRRQYQFLLFLAYSLCLSFVIVVTYFWAGDMLYFLTTDYIAAEKDTFLWLLIGCGLLNLGRVLMVQGIVEKCPDKYWPAYAVLLCFFTSWCFMKVGEGEGLIAAQGFVWGTIIFVSIILLLNLRGSIYAQSTR